MTEKKNTTKQFRIFSSAMSYRRTLEIRYIYVCPLSIPLVSSRIAEISSKGKAWYKTKNSQGNTN